MQQIGWFDWVMIIITSLGLVGTIVYTWANGLVSGYFALHRGVKATKWEAILIVAFPVVTLIGAYYLYIRFGT